MEKEPTSFSQIVSDGILVIIAGSDTTATVLTGVFFYLLTHPEVYQTLRKEVDQAFPPGEGEPFDGAKLADMPYLSAVM